MSEYVLSYNYITAPFMYGKIKYSSPYRTKKYWFLFHKDHESRLTGVPRQPDKIHWEPHRLKIIDSHVMASRDISNPVSVINALDYHFDNKDSAPMFIDNDSTTDVFAYKTNSKGTRLEKNIYPVFKTFDKGLFIDFNEETIGDSGKYRNVYTYDADNNAYKTVEFGLAVFNWYFASKDLNRYTRYYNKDISAYKMQSNPLSIYHIHVTGFDKLISGKSIIINNVLNNELAKKDRLGTIVSDDPDSIIAKVAFDTIDIELAASAKDRNSMSFISEDLMSSKEIFGLYTQYIESAKGMTDGRNIINEIYSYTSILRTVPKLNKYINDVIFKETPELSDMYEDSSFEIPKYMNIYSDSYAEKTFADTMQDMKNSFFTISGKEAYIQYVTDFGYTSPKDFSITDYGSFSGKYDNEFNINETIIGYKGMPLSSVYENIYALKSSYNAEYDEYVMSRRDEDIYVHAFDYMLGLPNSKYASDFEVSFGNKKSDKWNLFSDSGNAAYKQYKDIIDGEILNAWQNGKTSYAFNHILVDHGNDRSTSLVEGSNLYKIWHTTDLNIDGLFEKIRHDTAPTFTQYMMYKDIHYASTLYKAYGRESIHDETFAFRDNVYKGFLNELFIMSENGVGMKIGNIYENLPLAHKESKDVNETNQIFLYRNQFNAFIKDYFNGSYKDRKTTDEDSYRSLKRTIYDLISPDTDSNTHKSGKMSYILSLDISALRNDRFAMVDYTSSIGSYKNPKDILNISTVFGERKNYQAMRSYYNPLADKSAHGTDSTDWMHLFVDYTGAIGRNVFVYDASIIHKLPIDTSIADDGLIFTYKKDRNIYASDENTFSLKTITKVFLSMTENIYKMYTDTFTESVNAYSVYKVDRIINADDIGHFAWHKIREITMPDNASMIWKRYYDVIGSDSRSSLFITKKIRDVLIQDNIPYTLKPDYITNIASPNLYINKFDNDTTTDYNGIPMYKVHRDILAKYSGEGILKTRIGLTNSDSGDITHKTIGKAWYNYFEDRINKTRLSLTIEGYFSEVEHIRRKIALFKTEPYIIKDRYSFTPSIWTFEEIKKKYYDISYDKNIWWVHKKNTIISMFPQSDLYIFKTDRDINMSLAELKWITIHKNARDMYPTEMPVAKTIKQVKVDDGKFNNVIRNMFSVDAWMMINSNAGSFIGISARNLDVETHLNVVVKKISRDTMTYNSLLSYLKATKHTDDNSIIPIKSVARPIYENEDIIPVNTYKNFFFDDGLFTHKIRRSVGTFINRMVAKNKIKTFIDNYSISIYKKSFDVLAQYSGYIIHKKGKPIYVDANGISVYKTPFDTAIRDTTKWFSIIKEIYFFEMERINKRDNITFINEDVPITTRMKSMFMYDMVSSGYNKYGSLYENVYANGHQKMSEVDKDVHAFGHEKTAGINSTDYAEGSGKLSIVNMMDVAFDILRTASIAELEAINFDKNTSVRIINLDGNTGDSLLIPVSKMYNNTTYMDVSSVLKKYMELNIAPNDFGSWAWVEEPENPFDNYNDLQLYGGIDELLLPEQDYRYENFEDIIFNRKTNRPRNPVKKINNNTWVCKYPTKHPFKNTHPNAGVAYVGEVKDNYYGVNVKIMQEIYLKYYQIWQENLFKFSTMSMHEASNAMLEYIYSWILLYYPPEYLEQALRVFRQIRWFSECAVLNNSQYIVSGEWVDLKMLDIPNDLDDNDTMYYDEKTFSIRNTKESLGERDPQTGEMVGRTEAAVEFHCKVWKDTILTFSVLIRHGTMNLYIDDVLVDQISSTRRFNSYPIKFTDEEVTIRFEKTEENNVGDFLLADVTLKGQKFGELEVQFDPKLKAGNKTINIVADKMRKWANMYDDAAEALEELQKKNIGVAVTIDMMEQYLELHHKNKTKGKRLTIKKT